MLKGHDKLLLHLAASQIASRAPHHLIGVVSHDHMVKVVLNHHTRDGYTRHVVFFFHLLILCFILQKLLRLVNTHRVQGLLLLDYSFGKFSQQLGALLGKELHPHQLTVAWHHDLDLLLVAQIKLRL